jgi:hypothetical protein
VGAHGYAVAGTSALASGIQAVAPLAGTTGGMSTPAAALSTTVPLAGNVTGITGLDAVLAVGVPGRIDLTGSLTGTSETTGSLGVIWSLHGDLAGTGELAAMLQVVGGGIPVVVPLVGSVTGLTRAFAVLSTAALGGGVLGDITAATSSDAHTVVTITDITGRSTMSMVGGRGASVSPEGQAAISGVGI